MVSSVPGLYIVLGILAVRISQVLPETKGPWSSWTGRHTLQSVRLLGNLITSVTLSKSSCQHQSLYFGPILIHAMV